MSRQALPLSCQNHPNLIRRHFSHLLSTQQSAECILVMFVCSCVCVWMNQKTYICVWVRWIEGVGDNSGFTPGLAACGRIWGVCAPDAGTPLCAAGWLIFITAHNDGAREWGLGWKRHGETKERRAAKEKERGEEGRK